MSPPDGVARARGRIVAFDELAPTEHSHEFVGAWTSKAPERSET